ncbi:MAG: PIN domain-containing protein [Firmicutes bacterium]|nr:PIN domain-containing protein [Bacillota bacterium]
MTTVMLDTCVIIDALQKREPFWKDAENIFIAAAEDKFLGVITAKSLTDVYYLHHRCTHNTEKTKEILKGLLEIFVLSDTASSDCRRALLSEVADFEDAVMMETAGRLKVSCIVTRNVKDYKNSPVPVMSPEQFVAAIKAH